MTGESVDHGTAEGWYGVGMCTVSNMRLSTSLGVLDRVDHALLGPPKVNNDIT